MNNEEINKINEIKHIVEEEYKEYRLLTDEFNKRFGSDDFSFEKYIRNNELSEMDIPKLKSFISMADELLEKTKIITNKLKKACDSDEHNN